MVKKGKTIYVCENCGNEQLQWGGKCPSCGEWNSLREVHGLVSPSSSGRAGRSLGSVEIVSLADVPPVSEERKSTGISEFDRALGGGLVPGSLVLLAGEPGIGKSTLLMQLAGKMPGILYVSGEESANQIRMRANRLGITEGVDLLIETNVDALANAITTRQPSLVIIDSIQTLYSDQYPSTPGSILQVRECALQMQQVTKRTGVPMVMVGHVTKEGGIAGPRTLEHLVDVVLYLEGERHHGARMLRTVKNRFGATDEIGIFEMRQEGLVGIDNPSGFLLAQRQLGAPGSVVGVTLEGTRPLLVEVQALTVPTSFGYPKRTSSGFDLNRLNLLIAVLQRRAGINLSNADVYVNVVGGLQLREPALDAAIAISLVSAAKNIPVPADLVVFGEIGLSGEIRSAPQEKTRAAEAARLGYGQVLRAKTIDEAVNSYFPRKEGS